MPKQECLTCKAGNETHHKSAVENTGCEKSYLRVDACMKLYNGRVSACIDEWNMFRQCYEQGKIQSGSRNKSITETSIPWNGREAECKPNWSLTAVSACRGQQRKEDRPWRKVTLDCCCLIFLRLHFCSCRSPCARYDQHLMTTPSIVYHRF
ncbi:unnamed protein product [Peronospora belbahrii]|uniref:Uncharacterized protein n=1 Tax=Peronospora belbahrii TaxID=622444 RepID=A0AAU9LAZ4_9STRA|nr:unnamed protein product [Peronospora belbahrii]CAH0514334.1 unnamed protein product [Peronospora belbahrii]